MAQQKLTPCEYKCLLVLLEGLEQTKAQIAKILADTPQHIGTAMIHLEHLGMVTHTRQRAEIHFLKLIWIGYLMNKMKINLNYNDVYFTEKEKALQSDTVHNWVQFILQCFFVTVSVE